MIRIGTLSVVALLWSLIGGNHLAAQQSIAPEKVVGRDNCKQCHAAEFRAWENSSHNQTAWSQLEHTKAAEFAKAIGVTDIKGDSACTKCHGTHQMVDNSLTILKGNSCESCHGGAGGDNGWLAKHYDFSQGRTVDTSTTMAELLADRLAETPDQRKERDHFCKSAGMIRSADPVAIARNCLTCHLVPDEELQKAGHPFSSKFEIVEWSNGEVRHNFLLDPNNNNEAPTNWLDEHRNGKDRTVEGRKRLMYVAGQLADLEVSLRIRAGVTSTKRGTLGDEMNDRILDVMEELEDLKLDTLKPVLEVVKDVKKKSLKSVTDDDKTLYSGLADAVAEASDQFVAADPGGKNLPDEIKIRAKVMGDAYDGK